MTTLFISDLHLDESRPDITAGLLRLLSEQAPAAEALYILGDLFEAWIGDDEESALADSVANALRRVAELGIPIRFAHGNRDFLIGETYAARCGMQMLAETTVVDLYGIPTLLLHGDTLCSDDLAYQAFRSQVRQSGWQQGFLAQPLSARRAFAAEARARSQQHTRAAGMAIMDVAATAVTETFRLHGASRMIHGHTHRPAIHPSLDVDGRSCQRIVLGDWHHHGSMLRVDASGASLITLPLATS
jgi:UDP-2,3-diacylglucosamine hydrolase